ncbi:MAG: tetratricopeptide repeat protein [Veillonellaceae bacterium]|nr:tetratricopeptide repeat protein [Veillonellaceae bacterium]
MQVKAALLGVMLGLCLGNTVQAAPLVEEAKPSLALLQQNYEEERENLQVAQDYAVALARDGQYEPALAIFKNLSEYAGEQKKMWFDYAVVAYWAGDYATAVRIYEDQFLHMSQAVPDYVRVSVASAYFKLERYNEAWQLYHQSVQDGNQQARLWEAESLAYMGKSDEASKIYEVLLEEQPENLEAYSGQAKLLFLRGDAIGAVEAVDKALALIARNKDKYPPQSTLTMRGDMAVQCIRNGDYHHGIILLRPAIEDGSATINMQCDYILALFLYGDYKTATSEAERIWPDYRSVPVYGRRALADSYLRYKMPNKAIPIYRSIWGDTEPLLSDKQSLAYSYLLSGKNNKTGIQLYTEIINTGIEQAMHVTYDANIFFEMGRHDAGKNLYNAIINTYPDNVIIRQRFAAALYNNGLIREAYEQYQVLSTLPNSQPAATSGIINSAVTVGDYHVAESALKKLNGKYSLNPVLAQAVGQYDRRLKGDMYSSFSSSEDYKGNDVRTAQIIGEQRLGDRFSVLGGVSRKRISDNDGAKTLKTVSVGGRYVDMKHTAQLWLDQNHSKGNFSGYRFSYDYYFGEHSWLDFGISRVPVADAQALAERTMMTEYRLGFNRQIGIRDIASVTATTSNYTDGNHRSGFSLDWEHIMINNSKKRLSWFSYYGRDDYKKQEINGDEPVYESPETRESYGVGLRYRWIYPKHYWESSLALGWGRDRPEPVDFNPTVRLEYGYNFVRNQALVVGIGYGLRTGYSTNTGGDLQFADRQLDVNYYFMW